MLVGTVVLVTLLQLQDRVEPALGVLAVGLAAAVWGALGGRLAQPSFLLQVTGLVAWAALVLAGLTLAGDVARYVVAAGWFAHGLWDLVHLRADATVARSAAEWCAVVDLLVPAALLLPLVL